VKGVAVGVAVLVAAWARYKGWARHRALGLIAASAVVGGVLAVTVEPRLFLGIVAATVTFVVGWWLYQDL